MNENIEPIDKYDYFLDENGDNLNLEIDAPIVRAIPIQKSLNWKKFNDSAKAYLSGVPIQGLDVDPNSKYSKSWAHNVNSFAKAVAENQSYTISPYKQYTATDLHELARHFNNFDLNTSKIDFGNIKPKKLVKDYVKDHPEVSEETQQELLEQFKRLKVNEQTNKRTFKTARRYAGSDQQYKEDRKFYEDLGERGALIAAAIPAGYVAAAALTGAAYTAPYWGPWVAKNIVLPYLGGKVVNGATKWITDGKYNSFGDWAYNETPLNEWTEGTWLEEPTRFATDMLNPGYWAPYNKITKWAGPRIGKFIDGIKWKAYNVAGDLVGTQIYKNPKAIKSAENIFQMIPKQHQYSFAQGVIKGNKTAALNAQNSSQWFTTEGMPNPKTTFYSGFPINSSNNSFNIFHSAKGTFIKSPSSFIFSDYRSAINSPENILGLGLASNFSSSPTTEIVDPIKQVRQLRYKPGVVRIPSFLDGYSYLSRLPEETQVMMTTYSPKDKFLANRLFRELDRKELLKYYTNPDGTLTFTPENEILHLTPPDKPYVWGGSLREDPNWKAIEWNLLDKTYHQGLDNIFSSNEPIAYETLSNYMNKFSKKGYFMSDDKMKYYRKISQDLRIPDMSSSWADVESEIIGARMYDKAQRAARMQRRVQWPMRESKLSPMELLGIPKHERTIQKRPNIGINIPSDMRVYRVTSGMPSIVGGKIQHISAGPRYIKFDGKLVPQWYLSNTLHTTTDRLVSPHSSGDWDDKGTVLVNSMKNFANANGAPISLEPMDTFFSTNTPVIPTKDLIVFTDNPSAATMYRTMGATTYWRPKGAYGPDARIGGLRFHRQTLEDYEKLSQLMGVRLPSSLEAVGENLYYEGAPKNHSMWPNVSHDGFKVEKLSNLEPHAQNAFIETLKRALNKGTLKLTEKEKLLLLENNKDVDSDIYDKLVDALGI